MRIPGNIGDEIRTRGLQNNTKQGNYPIHHGRRNGSIKLSLSRCSQTFRRYLTVISFEHTKPVVLIPKFVSIETWHLLRPIDNLDLDTTMAGFSVDMASHYMKEENGLHSGRVYKKTAEYHKRGRRYTFEE